MLRNLLLVAVLIVLILFAASNPQAITLALWPNAGSITAPLALAVFALAGGAFALGALEVWLPRFLRVIVLVPVLVLLIVFAASNPQGVTLTLWPWTQLVVSAPLPVITLAIAAIAFVIGALSVPAPVRANRMRAEQAEKQVSRLQAQVAKLEAKISGR